MYAARCVWRPVRAKVMAAHWTKVKAISNACYIRSLCSLKVRSTTYQQTTKFTCNPQPLSTNITPHTKGNTPCSLSLLDKKILNIIHRQAKSYEIIIVQFLEWYDMVSCFLAQNTLSFNSLNAKVFLNKKIIEHKNSNIQIFQCKTESGECFFSVLFFLVISLHPRGIHAHLNTIVRGLEPFL